MKQKPYVSFRYRLFMAFLVVSLIPLLLCTGSLVHIASVQLDANTATQSTQQLAEIVECFSQETENISLVSKSISENATILAGLTDGSTPDTAVYSELFTLTGQMREIARFDLYDASGRLQFSTQRFAQQQQLPLNWGILHAAVAPGQKPEFIASETSDSLLQCAYRLQSSENEAGFLVVSFTSSNFSRMLGTLHSSQSNLIILSPFGRPLYCSGSGLSSSLASRLRSRLLSGDSLSKMDDGYLFYLSRHEESGILFLLQIPHVFTAQMMRLLRIISYACALICVAFSILLSLQFSRHLFSPVQQLQEAIGQVEQNNLDIFVPSQRNDEIGQLADHFNSMVCATKRNQQQLLENQKQLNEAQIRMLQAQLNPHFLCNTLDTMKWLSKINQVPQVATMSTDLADILRFSISPEEFVPLSKECEILERYVEIQRLRLADSFIFSMEIPPELEDCLIPKMMLQPIVENAILHGLDGISDGEIYVTAEAKEGVLQISVQDNGHGLPPEMVGAYRRQSSDNTRHLGLYNVHTILQKNYGPQYGLTLQNRTGGGATILAILPLKLEEAPC